MNETISSTGNSDMGQQVAALQRQVFLLLVALNVLAATMVFYLFYQGHVASQEYDAARPVFTQKIQEYNKNALAIQNFEKQLVLFGTTHPSFQPILKEYGLLPGAASPAAPAP